MKVLLVAAALASAVPMVTLAPVCAAPAARASVHIVFEDGSTRSRCVGLDGEVMTGLDLLRGSGAPVITEEFAGAGSLVCAIGGHGRDFPAESCVPPCPTGSCRFWAYFTRDRNTGAWMFSNTGASSRALRDGDADAWVLGVHRISSARAPTGLDENVCARGVSHRTGAEPRNRIGLASLGLAQLAPMALVVAFGAAAVRRGRRRRAA